jgi:hypothetical protein
MGRGGKQPLKIDRRSGLFLGYVFATFGAGMLLMGVGGRDLLFPVGGGFFVVSGVALATFGLAQPRPVQVEPLNGFGRFFRAAFLLLLAGFVFLCGEFGPGVRWMGIVGVLLSMPFVTACVLQWTAAAGKLPLV